ncbi:MAG TPA: hypothetical protein VGE19_07390 [Pseudoxanthomonas sp.]
MNNQAAQTMPELPEPAMPASSGGDEGNWEGDTYHDLYDADQMHQYARDYAASQTAGVVVKWEVRRRFWSGAPWGPWESYETEAERTESFAKFEGSEWLHETRELYAAAPAASGGEDDRSGWCRSDGCVHKKFGEPTWKEGDSPFQSSPHPDALQDGTLSKSTAKRVEALAAASVSERARALLASVYEADGLHGIAQGFRNGENQDSRALRAIEQALTQQRGTGS